MSKIVALVDGSPYSATVCEAAAWIAQRKGASVEIAHILGPRQKGTSDLSGNIGLGARTKLMDELATLDAERAKLAQKRGRAILEDAEAILEEAGVPVETQLRNGDLVEELHRLEQDADLVIVGKRGEAADYAKMHLGSNLERVVRSVTKPILVASQVFKPVETIMVAFDGGTSALKAVDHLARSKVFGGLKCHLLFVGAQTEDSRRAIEGAAALLKGAGYDVSHEITSGTPDEVIADRLLAGEAEMLMMGAYGHSRIRNLIIGSTTTEMIRSCRVPLLLFR